MARTIKKVSELRDRLDKVFEGFDTQEADFGPIEFDQEKGKFVAEFEADYTHIIESLKQFTKALNDAKVEHKKRALGEVMISFEDNPERAMEFMQQFQQDQQSSSEDDF